MHGFRYTSDHLISLPILHYIILYHIGGQIVNNNFSWKEQFCCSVFKNLARYRSEHNFNELSK